MKKHIYTIIALLFISMSVNAQIDRSKQPKPGPAPKISLENPKEFELKNGLKVLVVENHKLPRVAFSLNIDRPPVVEGNKSGMSSLLGAMLGNGTTHIAKDAFNEEVDFLGARINFSSAGGTARTLSKYSERILELMADAAIHPLLTEEEFQKEKNKQIDGIKSTDKSVAAIAQRLAPALSYGVHHPYGEFVTKESLNNISLTDVKNFYKNHFNPNEAYLVIVGDVNYKKIKKEVHKYFGKWEKSDYKYPSTPKVTPNVNKTEIDFIDMPHAVQSNISFTNNVNLKISDPDYFAVLIANKILGGGFNGYLNMNLREAHGYTYGAYSSIGVDKYAPSRFRAGASVRNAVTDSAVVETIKEINRIKKEPVDAEALKNAKAKYVGDFVLSLEKPSTIALNALTVKVNNLPKDFYKTYLEKINAVTVADVQRVANKYFKSDNARFVVVGKGSDVLENLEKTGIPIKYYDTYAKSIAKPNYAIAIPSDVNVQKVLNNYIEAIGGRAKLDKVNSVLIKAEAELQPGMMMQMEMKKTVSNQFMQDLSMMGNSVSKQVLDGNAGYVVAQGQKKDMTPEEVKKVQAESSPFPEVNYLNQDVKLEKIEKVNGENAYKIKVSDELSVFYSVETGLKLKETRTVPQGSTSIFYKEYKDVTGIKFPFRMTQTMGPRNIDFLIKEIKVNEGVSDADFK